MEKLEHYRWVDNSIDIDDFYDTLPQIIKDIIAECEKADKNDDYSYTNMCDALENFAKQFVPDGTIKREHFDRLCCRYYG